MSPPVVTAAPAVVVADAADPAPHPWHSTQARHDTTLTISSTALTKAPPNPRGPLALRLQHPRRKATLPLGSAALRLTAHSCTKGCLLCYFALNCLRPSNRS